MDRIVIWNGVTDMKRYNETEILDQLGVKTTAEAVLKLKEERRKIKELYGESSREWMEIHTLIRKIRRNSAASVNQYGVFIGKRYGDFIGEAKKLGVSRAVPKNVAHQYIGRSVACMTDFDKETGVANCVGYFKVTKLNIVTELDKINEIVEQYGVEIFKVDREVERECGKYQVSINMTVNSMIAGLLMAEADRVMIAGEFVELVEPVTVKGLVFTRGVFECAPIAGIDGTLTPDEQVQVDICRNYIRNF